jgi:signal peptidase II
MNIDIMGAIRSWFRHAWIVLAVAAVIIALDQWTKSLVRDTIPIYGSVFPIPALGEYFYFQHIYNYGAAFGILQAGSSFFITVAAIVSIAILVYVRYLSLDQWFVRVMLGLQMGGALGNVIDRIYQGYVTDFIKMGIPDVYYWPTYNIADSGIVIGVIGLGIYIVGDDIRRQRQARAAAEEEHNARDRAEAHSLEQG